MRNPASASGAGPVVVFVDHTSQPGGGEFGLRRLVAGTVFANQVLLLEEGALAEWLRDDGADLALPPAGAGRIGRLRWLRRRLRDSAAPIVVSNSLRAAVLVAIVKPGRMRHVGYLQDGVDAQSLGMLRRLLTRWAYRRIELALVNSAWTRATLAGLSPTTPSTVVWTASGASAELPSRPDRVGSADALRVVFVGRLVPWKGPQLLLDAVELVRRSHPAIRIAVTVCGAAIMGDQTFAEELRARVVETGLPVEFVGQVEVAPYLAWADVLVHCSIRPEPFGQVIVQGLAAGLAVVAPDAGGPAEILAPIGADAVYPMGDAHSLAQRLLRLATDRALLRRLAVRGPAVAEAYADARNIELVDAALTRLAETSGRIEALAVFGTGGPQ